MNTSTATDYQAVLPAAGFALGIRCDATAIRAIEFIEPRPALLPSTPLAEAACTQLSAYFNDPQHVFTLPLAPAGTPFQQRVWEEICRVPLGKVTSYGQLAEALQSAPRAVGQACGANPYPIVVPCHRIVAKQGGLGGFNRARGGFLLDVKRWLLRHEGIPLDTHLTAG